MSRPAFTFYEFFAGGGMARLGLGAGWRCLFANDRDRLKAATYRANFGGDDFREGKANLPLIFAAGTSPPATDFRRFTQAWPT